VSEPKPYAVCFVAFPSGDDLASFETFDVPRFGDIVTLQQGPGGRVTTYEVVRVERHLSVTYGGRLQPRATVSLDERDAEHRSPQERDRVSMADAALVARDLLGYGTFDLGELVCSFLRDRQEALVKLRSLVPSEERSGVAALLANYLETRGGAS
jgi:hypothetical protein